MLITPESGSIALKNKKSLVVSPMILLGWKLVGVFTSIKPFQELSVLGTTVIDVFYGQGENDTSRVKKPPQEIREAVEDQNKRKG